MKHLVYSTDQGRHCKHCHRPLADCHCSHDTSVPAGDGIVRLQLQTKGRKGKGVTVITGIPLAGKDLKKLAKELKQRCGTGGAIKDATIEIQGDQRSILEQALQDKGYSVKISGA